MFDPSDDPRNHPSPTTLIRNRALHRRAQSYRAIQWVLAVMISGVLSYLGLSYLTAYFTANESVVWLGTHAPIDPMHTWFVIALALLAGVQAAALRRPLQDIDHEKMLSDISNLMSPLVERLLAERYQTIASAFRASRVAGDIKAECDDIGDQVSELLALLATISAQELEPYERELRTVRSLLPAAQTKAEQIQTYLDQLQGEITELEDKLRVLNTTQAGQTAKADRLYQRILEMLQALEELSPNDSSVVTNLHLPLSK